MRELVLGFSMVWLLPRGLPAQDFQELERKITEFTLPNGLHLIVAERHDAPVVSFHTYVNAGSVDDPSGATGLAHLLERLAFTGTETIGTQDWPTEKKELDAVEELYDRLDAERNKGPRADQARISTLAVQIDSATHHAQLYGRPNEYGQILEQNGAAALKAVASIDSTEFSCSLPSNRLELWFFLESQRLLRPAFRAFYEVRAAAIEERTARIDSNAEGKLLETFAAAAFEAHPYRNPTLGWPGDLAHVRRRDARRFFDEYYVPANITIAIAGDVNPAEVRRLAERYFGPVPARPLPPLVHTLEPAQPGPRRAVVTVTAQPRVVIGFKRPSQSDPDDPVFDVLQLLLSSGRSAMLFQDLVLEKHVSTAVGAVAGYPGHRYPSLMAFLLTTSPGHTVEENEKALDDLLLRLQLQPVKPELLARAKTQARAAIVRRLADNPGLATLLATAYVNYGDWRKIFTSLDDVNKVTAANIQRVVRAYFVPGNRTVVYTAPHPAPAPAATGGSR